MTSVVIDSGDSYLDRNRNLFLTKLDLKKYRLWRQYSKYPTQLRCNVEIDGTRYWLTMDVSADGGGFVRFKEIDWSNDWPAQRRYAERAERLLPDRIFAAREHLIFERRMELPLEERQKLPSVDCCLVRYDNDDNHYRAHAHDRDYNEVYVTEFSSFFGAKRLLREWAVANDLYYGGGHTRLDSPAQFQSFISAMREHVVSNGDAAEAANCGAAS
jgi:hypothetical protein